MVRVLSVVLQPREVPAPGIMSVGIIKIGHKFTIVLDIGVVTKFKFFFWFSYVSLEHVSTT